MADPNSQDEYNARYLANSKYEGSGFDTTCVTPCPFCAAPDFARWKIIEVESAMQTDTKCVECGRSAKALFERTPSGIGFELVQTGGPDQPAWMNPQMRRVS